METNAVPKPKRQVSSQTPVMMGLKERGGGQSPFLAETPENQPEKASLVHLGKAPPCFSGLASLLGGPHPPHRRTNFPLQRPGLHSKQESLLTHSPTHTQSGSAEKGR